MSKNKVTSVQQYYTAIEYFYGNDAEIDREKAIELLTASASAKRHEMTRSAIEMLIRVYKDSRIGDKNANKREAVKWQNRMCNYLKATVGADNAEFLDHQVALAFAYYDLGEKTKARSLMTRVYNRKVQLFGENSPTAIRTLCAKCCLYNPSNGDDNYFYKIIKEAEKKLELIKDVNDQNVMSAYYNYANALEAFYDHPPFYVYEDMRKWVIKFKGEGSKDDLDILSELAEIYYCLEFDDEALATEKLRLKYAKKLYGKDDPYTMAVCESIARLYYQKGRYKTALGHLEKIVNSPLFNEQDAKIIAETYYNLAICHYITTDIEGAIEYAQKAYDVYASANDDSSYADDIRKTLSNGLTVLKSNRKPAIFNTRWLFGWAQLW